MSSPSNKKSLRCYFLAVVQHRDSLPNTEVW
uniref:Uncharacterized protein n=1 Tax=Caudovirales sp. ctXjW8 TaxID=2826779 RepID=A0A8S5N5J3_9CAUD|nr:MAG TPA: hypothetical protein [Caudovirales sp. ctXjW8]